ncbi:MAG: DUF1361 domain-containing protein [Oscillospiraceae bacterium]|jgi:uncharacterized membrane protein|nr:DUF1361 domain-containing protein [Oscillospiraceae bacterium]
MNKILHRVYPRWLPEALFAPLALLACMAVAVTGTLVLFYSSLAMRKMMLWNIFLSGLPFLFACGLYWQAQQGGKAKRLLALPLWLLWIFFFPNAPYMLTDLIHLRWYEFYISGVGFTDNPVAWFGLLHMVTGVAAGAAVGMLSLRLLHSVVRTRHGSLAGWGFVGGVCALSGVGVWIGRCLRLNSWDVFTRPGRLAAYIMEALGRRALMTMVLFATLTAMAYLLVYVFTLQIAPQKANLKEG